MGNLIDNVDFFELESERYWSFPKSTKKDPKTEAKRMIFSGEYVGSRKMDGSYYRFVKDMEGNMVLQGRSRSVKGGFLNKIGHVPHLHKFFESLPNGTCLLGELYFPNNEGSNKVTTIMGCLEEKAIKRQEKNKLHYYVFDVWAYNGKSLLTTTMEERISKLYSLYTDCLSSTERNVADADNKIIFTYDYPEVEIACYFNDRTLWEQLQRILEIGGEGVVITRKDSVPEPGKRRANKTLKIKKEIAQSIDCFFTGNITPPTRLYAGKEIKKWKYWENVSTGEKLEGAHWEDYMEGVPIEPVTKPYFNNWAGSLEIGVLKEGKVFPIGWLSGLSDDIKANVEEYKDKPIEVTAMEFTEDKALRHGKLVCFRPDLLLVDCNYEKIWGKENEKT